MQPADPVIAPILPTPAVTDASTLEVVIAPAPTSARKPKLFRYPSLLALPSKTAIPRQPSYAKFLQYSFLPTSLLKGILYSMLLSLMSQTVKTTVSLFLELLPALQSHSKTLRSPSYRYFQLFHHPQLSHTNASFSTLACHVQHLVQLGVFRKTAIPGQFCLEWLQSSYMSGISSGGIVLISCALRDINTASCVSQF